MSTTLTASFGVNLAAQLVTLYGNLTPALKNTLNFAFGTGSNQADQIYIQELAVVAAGTPKDIDLVGGGLTQPDGAAFAPAKIVGLGILNLSAAQILTVGAGSNPWISWLLATGDGVKIGKSGWLSFANPVDGFAVTAGTADILRIASDGGSNVPFILMLLGRSV